MVLTGPVGVVWFLLSLLLSSCHVEKDELLIEYKEGIQGPESSERR